MQGTPLQVLMLAAVKLMSTCVANGGIVISLSWEVMQGRRLVLVLEPLLAFIEQRLFP